MTDETFVITVKLAGVPAKVRCRYQKNHEFLLPYSADEREAFTVEPTEADLQFARSLLVKSYGEPVNPYPGDVLENMAIHNVLSWKLLSYNVLLLHGSALCMDGEAYIFLAPSGTGKSTHTRFWRETFGDRVWMIDDDKPMVRIENGRAVVYGTPWNGKHRLGRNASAPLKAIVWLTRGTENTIERLEKADFFPMLLYQTAWRRTAEVKPQVLRLETALLNAAAVYRLSCNLDPDAARIAWEGMRDG